MKEAAIRQTLDKTRVFAERQKLLKELWRAECESAVKAQDNFTHPSQQRDSGVTQA